MVVAKTASTNSKFFSLVGTDTEVLNALDTEGVPANQIVAIYYNGSNTTAIYKRNGSNT